MASTEPRLDPERSRRRTQLLAQLAGARVIRERATTRRLREDRLRNLILARRRLAN